MNWLRTKILNFLSGTQPSRPEELSKYAVASPQEHHSISDLHFTVSSARGGLIVNVRTYDKQRDRHDYINHIIHDDQDVAKNIADIVAVEIMKA
jgi:hypothetical protein